MIFPFSLFYKVIKETLVLPLYFTIGKTVDDGAITANKIKTGLIVVVVMFSSATVILYFISPWLVTAMAQDSEIFDHTVSYIRYETE